MPKKKNGNVSIYVFECLFIVRGHLRGRVLNFCVIWGDCLLCNLDYS